MAERRSSDLLVFNSDVDVEAEYAVFNALNRRSHLGRILYLFLTTDGGRVDSAFRIMRRLQEQYESIVVVVAGSCKRAGTLMCIGADELHMGPLGELGALDIQAPKTTMACDKMSGLVSGAALGKLQAEASKFFTNLLRDANAFQSKMTPELASKMATEITVGLLRPIFEKIDPADIGEAHRGNLTVRAYAERLNIHSDILCRPAKDDALDQLLLKYPSQDFVIERGEAGTLFKRFFVLDEDEDDDLCQIVRLIGMDAILPRTLRPNKARRVEYLNKLPGLKGSGPPNEGIQGTSGRSHLQL
ncbi:hypothetical protein Q9L58_010966, partial [Maublancomyces gigas]